MSPRTTRVYCLYFLCQSSCLLRRGRSLCDTHTDFRVSNFLFGRTGRVYLDSYSYFYYRTFPTPLSRWHCLHPRFPFTGCNSFWGTRFSKDTSFVRGPYLPCLFVSELEDNLLLLYWFLVLGHDTSYVLCLQQVTLTTICHFDYRGQSLTLTTSHPYSLYNLSYSRDLFSTLRNFLTVSFKELFVNRVTSWKEFNSIFSLKTTVSSPFNKNVHTKRSGSGNEGCVSFIFVLKDQLVNYFLSKRQLNSSIQK